MIELEKIPHIHEISNHGPYHGAREKNTATFQARSTRQNKLVPSLEEAIRRTGLKDGMTISFHHHFRNGDHIINTVVDKLAEMGYKNLTLAASSTSRFSVRLYILGQSVMLGPITSSTLGSALPKP